MSVFRGIQNLFGSRTVKRQPTRRRRFAVPQGLAACESLESRAMLAFTAFPVSGPIAGVLSFSSNSADPTHDLTIILDDVTTPGMVTATVTGSDGGGGVPKRSLLGSNWYVEYLLHRLQRYLRGCRQHGIVVDVIRRRPQRPGGKP